jgi:hypothetical protein
LTGVIPPLPSLVARQLLSSSVLDLEERDQLDAMAAKIIVALE